MYYFLVVLATLIQFNKITTVNKIIVLFDISTGVIDVPARSDDLTNDNVIAFHMK